MKRLILVAVTAASIATFAAAPAAKKDKQDSAPEQRVKYGGEGFIALVNAGGLAEEKELVPCERIFEDILMAEVKVSKGSFSIPTAAKDFAATGANAAVFVIKDPALPISLLALEARWAVVNANGLSPEAVRKEVTRVTTVLIGSCYSQYKGSVMRPVFSSSELEAAGSSLTIDVLLPMLNGFQMLGIKPFSYDNPDAVEEGASQPSKK